MPELPEVQTTVGGLKNKVLNRTFVDVWSDWPSMVKRPAYFTNFKKVLKGKKIARVWRRAKNVVFELSNDYSLLVHMKMTGHLMVGQWKLKGKTFVAAGSGPFEEKINGYLHMVFMLDDGCMIALSDMRKFAKIELVPTSVLQKEFENLGPEPLEKSFGFEKFRQCFAGKRGKIKEVLMRPEVIAGIGNIYASEALWWAKIHPGKEVSVLGLAELKKLYAAVKKVLSLGADLGGASFSDYRNVDGLPGKFEGKNKAYQRHSKPCYRCKTLIVRKIVGQRSAFFCPRCQKASY